MLTGSAELETEPLLDLELIWLATNRQARSRGAVCAAPIGKPGQALAQ